MNRPGYDEFIENMATHVVDVVERQKYEGRYLLATVIFYILFFFLIMFDRTQAAIVAFIGEITFWILFTREQHQTRLVRRHVRQIELENEPKYVSNARLIVKVYEESVADAVSRRCVEMEEERREQNSVR